MARGKKSSGKHVTSKSERLSVNKKITNAVRRDKKANIVLRMTNLINEWSKGNNPWVTVNNPNTNETNKRRIRVRANTLWGAWKRTTYANQSGSTD